MKTMPSLLAPAGNMRALQTALRFGADAVYCGAKQYGLRAQAGNFDEKQLEQAVTLAHAAGAQVNLTLNIFAFDGDLDGMPDTLIRITERVAEVRRLYQPDFPLLTFAEIRRVVQDEWDEDMGKIDPKEDNPTAGEIEEETESADGAAGEGGQA